MQRERVLLVFLACALVSCGHRKYSELSDVAQSPEEYQVELAGRAGGISEADRNFVYLATVSDLYVVASSELAVTRASDPAIQNFARDAMSQARAQAEQLARIGGTYAGVTAPTKLDREHGEMLDRLQGLNGKAFEKAYIDGQVTECGHAMQLFRNHAVYGSQPVLQRFAADQVPAIQERCSAAEAAAQQLH